MANSVRGNSSKVLPLQLNAAHSYIAISVRVVIPQNYSHFSPLLHGHFSQGLIPQKSSHCGPSLTSFHPLWTYYPLTLTPFYPPRPVAAQFLAHFTFSGQISHSLKPFYPPWQPKFYLISPPLDKLPPHPNTILPPWQPNSYIILPPPLAAQLIANFTPLCTNFPLTLTPFYPPWQPNS